MKLLSELDNNTMLKIGDEWDLMTKEEFLKSEFLNPKEYPDLPIVKTVYETVVRFDLLEAIENAGEGNTHNEWAGCVRNDIQSSDLNIAELENKINEMLKRNPTYWEDEEVEIDIPIGQSN